MTANAPFLGCHPVIRLWFLLPPVDFSRAWAKIWGELGSGAHTSSDVSGLELEAASLPAGDSLVEILSPYWVQRPAVSRCGDSVL